MNAATRALAIAERGERVQYGRRVAGATMKLVEAVQSTTDQEGRIDGWKAVQRLLGPAATYDYEVRP